MKRWMWWRPIAEKPTVESLQQDLADAGDRLMALQRERTTLRRERNGLARQLAGAQYALEQRERQLGEEGRLRSEALLRAENLQRELAYEQGLNDRVRAVLADEGLSEGQANARIRQVLMEGGGSDE